MVVVDQEVYRRVYSKGPATPGYVLTKIPMQSSHPAHGKVLDLLTQHLGDPKHAAKQIDSGAAQHATEVDVTTFLANPVHPVVMRSVMDPIRREWDQNAPADNTRSAFWSYRRARSLDTFVPVPRSTQATLVRGWIVGRVLGQLHGESDPQDWLSSGVSIWTPDGDRKFPRYPLGARVDAQQEILPLILLSLPLAFLSYADGRTEEVEAYNRLLDLGNPDQSGGIQAPGSSGSQLSESMLAWLETGSPEAGQAGAADAPLPNTQYAGPSSATAVDGGGDPVSARIQAVKEVLKGSKESAVSWGKLRSGLRKNYPLSFPLHGEIGELGVEAVEALWSGLDAFGANHVSGLGASTGAGL
jgi:hypothetical protein